MFQRLLVPYDFSPASEHALVLAVRIARGRGGSITLLNVGSVPAAAMGSDAIGVSAVLLEMNDRLAHERHAAIEAAARAAIPADVPWHVDVRDATPVDAILDAARDCDLVVMGTDGRRGMEHFVLGSVTERVLRSAAVPVLVTR